MATSIAQLKSRYRLPDRSGEQTEYIVWVCGCAAKLRWNQMTLTQRYLQIQAEERAAYDQLFDPCGFLF